eukprot:TRINITY_DN10448_c0_g1_i1.p1 TRINITY_DN10448_c0_g1~~TRINITY_DN10448_c0_g1_i1.p1  ORF type:complete len:284 (-),score=69.58 TRINITY_DN10448_c0_g1_i1:110-961(-)
MEFYNYNWTNDDDSSTSSSSESTSPLSQNQIDEANALFYAFDLPEVLIQSPESNQLRQSLETVLLSSSDDLPSYNEDFTIKEDLTPPMDLTDAPTMTSSMIDLKPTFNDHLDLIPQQRMTMFTSAQLTDFKHVIYNLLVEGFNSGWNPNTSLILELNMIVQGRRRTGFRFNPHLDPDKKMAELYAEHVKMARLDLENQTSIFIQDIYKYYLRACVELLGKYFQKVDKYRYLYKEDVPLFIVGGSLKEAEDRMRQLTSHNRKRREDKKTYPHREGKKSRSSSPE